MRFRATVEFDTFEGKEEDKYLIAEQIKEFVEKHIDCNVYLIKDAIGEFDWNISVIPV